MNYASDERLDCLIRLALIERAAKDVEAIQAMDTSSVVCPAKVDRRIHRMIARKAKEASTRKMKRVLVRVMVAALIVMSLTLALLLSVAGIREAIWKAIVDWCDGYVAVSFVPNEDAPPQPQEQGPTPIVEGTPQQDPQPSEPEPGTPAVTPPSEILEYKKPSDLPSGYEGEEVIKDIVHYMMDFYLDDEWKFTYMQTILSEEEKWIDDTDMEIVKQITIGNGEAVILLSVENSVSKIVWTDGEYIYSIDGLLEEAQLIAFAESVR